MSKRSDPNQMTKRLSTSLPDLTYQMLLDWANTEGTSLSDLTGYILKRAVEEAQDEGKIRPTRDYLKDKKSQE